MKSSPVNNDGAHPDQTGFAKTKAVKKKIKTPLLPQLSKILRDSDGALLPCENEPRVVMNQISRLRKELDGFPSQWAGKRRVVRRIKKKRPSG